MMTGSPGAFRSSPDPEPVQSLITEGLAHATDEETTAHLQVAFGMAARVYRGSEPFGQGITPDAVPLEERIAAAEEALSVGQSQNDPHLLWSASATLGLLYGMAGRYEKNLELAMQELALVE